MRRSLSSVRRHRFRCEVSIFFKTRQQALTLVKLFSELFSNQRDGDGRAGWLRWPYCCCCGWYAAGSYMASGVSMLRRSVCLPRRAHIITSENLAIMRYPCSCAIDSHKTCFIWPSQSSFFYLFPFFRGIFFPFFPHFGSCSGYVSISRALAPLFIYLFICFCLGFFRCFSLLQGILV